LATLLWCASPAHAQEQLPLEAKAPTLQAGLSGFSFSKGSLDAALIMEIIAEKQQELKLKTIQNVFLSRVEGSGATVYTFVDNVVRELVFESDQNLRTKGILENVVNMAFVGAFLNYYLETASGDAARSTLLKTLADSAEVPSVKTALANLTTIPKDKIISNATFNNSWIWESSKPVKNPDRTKFAAILLDMCSFAVREDVTLKRLGLLQTGYSETYEYLNLYLREKSKPAYDAVYKDIKQLLTKCTDAIGGLHYAASQSQFKFSDHNTLKAAAGTFNSQLNSEIDICKKSIAKLITELDAIVELSTKSKDKANFEDALFNEEQIRRESEVLSNLHLYLSRAKSALSVSKDGHTTQDILYTLHHDYIPLLQQQPLLRSDVLKVIEEINGINAMLFESSTMPTLLETGKQIPQFLALVAKLYELDQATTITEYLRILPEVSELFPDSKVKSALSLVFRFVKDYTVVETNGNNKEVLTFNAESFIYKLQSLKPDKVIRIGFHFTVGLNTATFARPQSIAEAAPTRNFSFVGEKVGLKWKLYDWSFTRGRNPGETFKTSWFPGVNTTYYVRKAPPKEPLISNWHVLAYGSGLLYNLVDAKTEQEFNMPLLGVGTGLTFFNGLDVNISCGVPIYNDRPITTADRFYSLGFDIQFIEYYERLAQKRKNAQTQKRLAEAAREQ
jgi:hypothetical protein